MKTLCEFLGSVILAFVCGLAVGAVLWMLSDFLTGIVL